MEQSDKKEGTATIESGASLSDAVPLTGFTPVALQLPAAWTAADISFQASWDDGVTFADVYHLGVEYVITGVPTTGGAWISIDPRAILGAGKLKVRSGVSATPVNQGAARTIKVISRGW